MSNEERIKAHKESLELLREVKEVIIADGIRVIAGKLGHTIGLDKYETVLANYAVDLINSDIAIAKSNLKILGVDAD